MVGIANGLAIICLGMINTGSDHTGAAQYDMPPILREADNHSGWSLADGVAACSVNWY